ncbi:serine proteinase inhibitor [Trichuris suis]|nr:serine proteinase inhibitor [Trichuris suis]
MFSSELADFSKITGGRDLYVSEAFHKAIIEINEKGSEAAAATALIMEEATSVGLRMSPPKFIADHPFLYAVMDRSNRIILFMGLAFTPLTVNLGVFCCRAHVFASTVHIPKFKLEYELQLKAVLQRLGLTDMFSSELADFSKITGSRDLYVSEAFHKAFIEVNEKGSEAAAATAVIMGFGASFVRIGPPKFIADHPFLYAVMDRSNRIILFIGDYYGSISV